ncbi:MAG: hypothetical protein ACFWUM_02020 [Eubacteriales bacterium]|jgi:hypothetical protein
MDKNHTIIKIEERKRGNILEQKSVVQNSGILRLWSQTRLLSQTWSCSLQSKSQSLPSS